MATGSGTDGGGWFAGLTGGVSGATRDIVLPSSDTRAAASAAADQVAAQAGGYASSAAQGVRDVFAGALDEFHAQEEQAATWLRWGTVAFALLVLLLVVAIGAWFFAPARALVGAVT